MRGRHATPAPDRVRALPALTCAPEQRRAPELRVMRIQELARAQFEFAHAEIEWPDGRTSEGWGRDADLELAGLKAAAEAVERHAYAILPPAAFEAPACELTAWIDPMQLVRYAPAQYAEPGFPFARFDPAQARWWIPATGVDDGRETSVLADFVCLPRAFDRAYRARLVTYATSSGCATDPSLAVALERAALELVERDAFMRHWFAQVPGRALRQQSLPTWAGQRLAAMQESGCRAGVQSLTLGVQPVLLAWAQHAELAFTCVGSACGFDAEATLATALGELETFALARIEGVPEQAIGPAQVKGPEDHGALYATRAHFRDADAVIAPDRAGDLAFQDVADALPRNAAGLYALMRERGHPVSWVDLSTADAARVIEGLPLHTVRVVAPGMVPIAFGHGLQPLGMIEHIEHIEPGGHLVHPFC